MMTLLFKGVLTLIVTAVISGGITHILTDLKFLEEVAKAKQETVEKVAEYGWYIAGGQIVIAAIMLIAWIITLIWNFGDILKSLGAGCS